LEWIIVFLTIDPSRFTIRLFIIVYSAILKECPIFIIGHFYCMEKNSEKLIKEKYNGNHPICGCGCGEKTIYDYTSKDFGKFKRGHQTRVNKNYFGDPKAPKRVAKIIATRKAKFASGEYDHVRAAIKQNRKDPDLGVKISKSAKGIPKPKPEGFGVGRIQSKETRDKMSKTAIKNILKTGKCKRSKLEIAFEMFFILLNIEYKHSFVVQGFSRVFIYDFYLPKFNCLIEVDGDYYHCNPNSKHSIPIHETQKINIKNDVLKNKWAKQNDFKLLRFWESDINNNPKLITEVLKKELNLNL
jgi:very-short-patch-repair endonuclease